ncbi:RNA polymerase sigma factor [Nonomuraea wenchangensis]|uniref:RNA polymerase sigma factor n=1 Tax=Nonomuraea wenchangensis TaxID=568860 RepID=UPI003789BA3B
MCPAVHLRLGESAADDIAGETFLRAFRDRARYDLSHPHARAWLYGIASNLVAGHRRAEARRYRGLARGAEVTDVASHDERVVQARSRPVRRNCSRRRPRSPPGNSRHSRAGSSTSIAWTGAGFSR